MDHYYRWYFDPLVYIIIVITLHCFIAFLRAAGYHKLAKRIFISLWISIGIGVVGFIAALFVIIGVMSGEWGEWSGIAVLVISMILGILAALVSFGFFTLRLVCKWRQYRVKKSPSLAMFGLGGFMAILVSLLLWKLLIAFIPSLPSVDTLVKQVSKRRYGLHSFHYDVEQEILSRGQKSVPAIISVLNKDPDRQWRLIRLLGEIGGLEAIQELRAWLNREAAESQMRAEAAVMLAKMGDHESTRDIARLLEFRTYEWKKTHPFLIQALGILKAREYVSIIRSALVQEPNEQPKSRSTLDYLILREGVRALMAMDSAESWAVIVKLSSDSSVPLRRLSVLRTLGEVEQTQDVKQILAEALDDPDPKIRETAYNSLLYDPISGAAKYPDLKLKRRYRFPNSTEWSANVQKIRAYLNLAQKDIN